MFAFSFLLSCRSYKRYLYNFFQICVFHLLVLKINEKNNSNIKKVESNIKVTSNPY